MQRVEDRASLPGGSMRYVSAVPPAPATAQTRDQHILTGVYCGYNQQGNVLYDIWNGPAAVSGYWIYLFFPGTVHTTWPQFRYIDGYSGTIVVTFQRGIFYAPKFHDLDTPASAGVIDQWCS